MKNILTKDYMFLEMDLASNCEVKKYLKQNNCETLAHLKLMYFYFQNDLTFHNIKQNDFDDQTVGQHNFPFIFLLPTESPSSFKGETKRTEKPRTNHIKVI